MISQLTLLLVVGCCVVAQGIALWGGMLCCDVGCQM